MKRTAVYAGSFDPPTYGHFDVIQRASDVFEKVLVLVAVNPAKDSMFSIDERVEMIAEGIVEMHLDNVSVLQTKGYVWEECADDCILVRGLRDEADLAEEQAIAHFNRERGVDTVWIPADPVLSAVSSRALKSYVECGSSRASIYASPEIIDRVRKKLGE